MFQIQDLLLTTVTAFVASDAAALMPDLNVARINLRLNLNARLKRRRVGIGSHAHAPDRPPSENSPPPDRILARWAVTDIRARLPWPHR